MSAQGAAVVLDGRPPRQAGLDRLAANARAGQWSADRDIDWRRAPRLPFWLNQRQARDGISQLYHGEMATSRLCRSLLRDMEPGGARTCLELQLADEVRHAEVYRRYLERLGGVAPMNPSLARALDAVLAGPEGMLGAMVAFHVVVEGEVLRLQDSLARFMPCPLLKEINRLIARDEARHVAFGRLYLAAALAQRPEAARRRLYAWVYGLWRESADATLAECQGGGLTNRFFRRWLYGGWDRHAAALGRVGLSAE